MNEENSQSTFEIALKQLNLLVEDMEKGNLDLETALAQFEKGVGLIRHCQDLLNKAQQRIQIYNHEQNIVTPFEAEE